VWFSLPFRSPEPQSAHPRAPAAAEGAGPEPAAPVAPEVPPPRLGGRLWESTVGGVTVRVVPDPTRGEGFFIVDRFEGGVVIRTGPVAPAGLGGWSFDEAVKKAEEELRCSAAMPPEAPLEVGIW